MKKNILNGRLEKDLVSIIPTGDLLEKIKEISIDKIYSYKSVIEREAAGYEVLGGLLDSFIKAVNDAAEGKSTPKGKLYSSFCQNNF